MLGKLVFDMTGSELALGLLGLAEFAPAALLVFVTGTVADRVDRRRLAAIALSVEALTVVGARGRTPAPIPRRRCRSSSW